MFKNFIFWITWVDLSIPRIIVEIKSLALQNCNAAAAIGTLNSLHILSISKYFDLTILADYYTNGSYGINLGSQYRKRYKYTGNFTIRYENLINGERGLPDYSKSTIYNIRWTHSKDSKSSPYSSLSADNL